MVHVWPNMQNQIHLCYKTDEGRERHCREHTSRHTSPEDGELADSRKAPGSSSERRLPAFISQKGISIVKKLKERGLKPPRDAARSFNSLDFAFEIGSGSPLPLISAWYDGYLWTYSVRVCR